MERFWNLLCSDDNDFLYIRISTNVFPSSVISVRGLWTLKFHWPRGIV